MATLTPMDDLGPKVAAARHPTYDYFLEEWIKLIHVREGTGGFKDGTYLVGHPREWLDHSVKQADGTTVTNPNPRKPSPKLQARRKLARYENLAASILEAKKAALFREKPTRRIGDGKEPKGEATETVLDRFWANVDGADTPIDEAMPHWWDLAATCGHIALYFELPKGMEAKEGEVATAADQDTPKVCVYTPIDILNWLCDENGQIISIKVREAVTPTDYSEGAKVKYRVRIITEEGWELYDFTTGKAIDAGTHGLGRLPVVFLFGKRRAAFSDVGQSVLGDPKLYVDLYNLTSEMRELERNQTFSFINIPLGTGQDAMSVHDAQAMMGQQTGTMNVLFSGGPASVLTADAANVVTYRDDIQQLKRDIYRETGVQWESDTKDAEAEGSLELKREEMNTRLAAYADECEEAEYDLADLVYRWEHGGEDGAKKLQEDQVTIAYPDRFGATPFTDVAGQFASAQSMGMPPLFLKEFRKSLVTKFEGMANLPPDLLEEINKQIDAAADDPTPAERMKQKMDLLAGGGLKPAVTKDPTKDDKVA